MQNYWIKISCALSLLMLQQPGFAAEKFYYRYKDAQGHPVITNSLPAEVADQGYDIISPRGNVIKTISPAKSKEELAADNEALEKKRQADLQVIEDKKKAETQAKKDDILLKSFSNEEDITRSRDEKIASIEVLEQIMRENLNRLNKQLKQASDTKAGYEKAGQALPEALKKTILETERQIKDNEAFLQRKKVEKNGIHTKYEGLIKRFHELNAQDGKHQPPTVEKPLANPVENSQGNVTTPVSQ
ncbi:MAG: hypothetical protein AB7V32_05855 [Candidatus Berkiella sp.]